MFVGIHINVKVYFKRAKCMVIEKKIVIERIERIMKPPLLHTFGLKQNIPCFVWGSVVKIKWRLNHLSYVLALLDVKTTATKRF